MLKPIEFHPKARRDFDEAVDWYAGRSQKAALGFVAAIDDVLERIAADPERFPVAISNCRSCSLLRFPFQVVFRIEANRLLLVAVAHAKRRPGYWSRRR